MIIKCEQCQTKFKLDDSKVTDKGVKVRCAKCKHVFSVTKEQSEAEPKQDFGALLDDSISSEQENSGSEMSGPSPSPDAFQPDTAAFERSDISSTDAAFSFDKPAEESAPVSTPVADDYGFSSMNETPDFSPDQAPAVAGPDEIDFSGMDFGNISEEADKPVMDGAKSPDFGEIPMESAPAGSAEDMSFDFGEESLFGDAVSVQVPDEPTETIKFDFQMDEFADSMGASAPTGDKEVAEAEDATKDEPFSLGEIDFGDELTSVAVQQVHPDELKPAQDYLFAPLGESTDKPAPVQEEPARDTLQPEPPAVDEDEMPPLSISSRRKQNSMLTAVITVVSLIIAGGLAFFGYSLFTEDKAKTVAESGRITVRSVNASFVKNPSGDLLVITGEAVNEFNKPRAAIQVKGLVYGANGQVLSSKNAYCGNPLNKQQLATMPVDKIEAAMANQFGDSLVNMEVSPGKAIPFVVVIPNPPADARDYGVEPAGSTVATAKQ